MDYVKTFTKSVTGTSEKMISQGLPKKLADIDRLLQQTAFSLKRLSDVRRCSWASMGIDSQRSIDAQITVKASEKVDKHKIKIIESNRVVGEGLSKLCSEVIDVLETCNTLRMWVSSVESYEKHGARLCVSHWSTIIVVTKYDGQLFTQLFEALLNPAVK